MSSAPAPGSTPGPAPSLVVMGVCGSGKTTLGRDLAQRLGLRFFEGDELHPPANVERMRAGIALTDDDRRGWLASIADLLRGSRRDDRAIVVSCSALKRAYRDVLREADPGLRLVFLHGSYDLLAQRLGSRRGHYMPASLLRSQLDTLEPPGPDERPIAIGVASSTDDQAQAVQHGIDRDRGTNHPSPP